MAGNKFYEGLARLTEEQLRTVDYGILVDFLCRTETHIAVLYAAFKVLQETSPFDNPEDDICAMALTQRNRMLCELSARFERVINYTDRMDAEDNAN